MAVEAGHHAGHRVLVAGHRSAHFFGIEPLGERRRPDEVDKHDSQLPTFGVVATNLQGRRRSRSRRRRICLCCNFGNGEEQSLAISQPANAKILQIVVAEMRQQGEVDCVVLKCIDVVAESAFLQPIS
ncbi:MAG: hypothetical protein AAF637_06470 [Pseudomonadota bacterium]